MIKYAKKNKSIGYIIVYSYDRFSRTGSNASQIIQNLLKHGVQVKAVTQEIDALSSAGKFQQNLFLMFSQFDNELRRDKTITAMQELVRKGHWLWAPPRGYSNNNKHHRAVDWDIQVNEEGKLLKKAFNWKLSGRYSNSEIVKKLNQLGMQINEKRINEVFKNPFYCGILVTNILPGEPTKGKHESIVSEEDFLSINNVKSIHPEKKNGDKEELPLKRFIYCYSCDTPLTGYLVKKKGLFYYKCRNNGCSCNKSAKKLHGQFEELLKQFEIDPNHLEHIAPIMKYKLEEITKSDQAEEKLLKKKKTELKNKLESIEERFAIGEIGSDVYNKYRIKYTQELEEIEQNLEVPEFASSNLDKAIEKAVDISKNISEYWSFGDLFIRKGLQQLLFPSGIKYDKENDRVLTTRVNSVFSAIPEITKVLEKNKSGESVDYQQISALVTSDGEISNFLLEDINDIYNQQSIFK